MGILDDAIRDHLDLKRRRGTDEPELKRLEDEAFGPGGRPDASGAAGPTASAVAEPRVESGSPEITPEDLGLESISETPPPDGPAPEEPPPPSPESSPEASGGGGGELAFHDFAAEEGLVSSRTQQPAAPVEPTDPVERALAQPTPSEETAEERPEEARSEEPASEADATEVAPVAEAPAPASEDTQVHDMAKELELDSGEAGDAPEGADEASPSGGDEAMLELEVEELEIELDEELDADEDDAAGSQQEDGEDEGEDVLEETPEFLRDAPESDRLWFEQGKPKDFDFDED